MKPDIDKYLPMLDGLDLTHDQKIDLIHDLWRIMQGFVDRAFGINTVHSYRNKNQITDLQDSSKRIDSKHTKTHEGEIPL